MWNTAQYAGDFVALWHQYPSMNTMRPGFRLFGMGLSFQAYAFGICLDSWIHSIFMAQCSNCFEHTPFRTQLAIFSLLANNAGWRAGVLQKTVARLSCCAEGLGRLSAVCYLSAWCHTATTPMRAAVTVLFHEAERLLLLWCSCSVGATRATY